ncbi:MAG: DUF362 domain-containing protein [Desulfobacterales bacterium]|nr:DUF362 domain-containing protein [Desulfobacterales bacterium]
MKKKLKGWSRRSFLKASLAAGALTLSGTFLFKHWRKLVGRLLPKPEKRWQSETFIAKAATYEEDIASIIVSGLGELGVTPNEVRGKKILLKPNLVETRVGAGHINTHPLVIRGAVDAFLKLGAASVIVAEGPGHCRDSMLILEESGLSDALYENQIQFVDLNYEAWYTIPNASHISRLETLTFPAILRQVDWIVSMAKMKTHHWAGVTLSMKNLFGVMPGIFYGWPKNVLHMAGIERCILDINAALRPHFAIVDGIVGMEGDGPIMGLPRHAGVIVMGRNLTAVDATCSRIMEVPPQNVRYLVAASLCLGPINEPDIPQLGENISSVRTRFKLLDYIPTQKGLRMQEIINRTQ